MRTKNEVRGMKINEVEALVGITRKNIRFYESEGLLTPRRNSENGYRDYGEGEVRTLLQIKLMRKLGVSLEEIRRYCAEQVDTLWDEVKRFDYPHDYYVDLSKKLWDIKYQLLEKTY